MAAAAVAIVFVAVAGLLVSIYLSHTSSIESRLGEEERNILTVARYVTAQYENLEHAIDAVEVLLDRRDPATVDVNALSTIKQTVDRQFSGSNIEVNIWRLNGLLATIDSGGPNIADRETFTTHFGPANEAYTRKNAKTGSVIGTPVAGRVRDFRVLPISRAYRDARGQMVAIVTATAPEESFLGLFGILRHHPNDTIFLMRDDRTGVVRLPFDTRFSGQSLPNALVFQNYPQQATGRFEGPAQTDGIRRIGVHHGLAPLPLVLGISFEVAPFSWQSVGPHAPFILVSFVVLASASGFAALAYIAMHKSVQSEAFAVIRGDEAITAERRLRAVLATAYDGIITLDENLRITTVNRAAETIFGVSEGDIANGPLDPLLPAAMRNRHGDLMRGMAQSPDISRAMSNWRTVKGLHASGREFPAMVSISKTTLFGSPMYLAVVRDMTEILANENQLVLAATEQETLRMLAEQSSAAMRHSAQRFYAMLSSLKAGLLVVGADGKAEFANQAFCDLFGLDEAPEDLTGMSSSAIIARIKPAYAHPDEAVARIVDLVRRDEITLGEEVEMHDRRVLLRDYIPIRVDGQGVGRLWQHVDITERRQIEEALRRTQRMDAVGQLTGGIAHDFNNMLMVVIGNLRMLADDPQMPDWAGTSIDLALKASQRGADLTAQLLAFSRQLHLSPQAIDLRNETEMVTRLMRRTIPASVAIETQAPNQPVVVRIDPGQLETALINLMLNARDAMPGGGQLTLKVAVVTVDEPSQGSPDALPPGIYGSIRVADTGTGMPESVKAQVFEPFFTTKPVGQGTGLGLSMVHGFIRQSGGFLQLHSTEGQGTRIDLFFPLLDSQPADAAESERLEDPALPADIHRILLVEDIDEVRTTIRAMLVSLGFDVVTARDSAGALSLLAQDDTVDMLLTDVGLPGAQDGRALAATAARRWPKLRIVTMSGHDAAGAPGSDTAHWPHLKKPFRRHDLTTALGPVITGQKIPH